ncbi:hypothetical protein NONI108955_44045 [Nocardia ninae]
MFAGVEEFADAVEFAGADGGDVEADGGCGSAAQEGEGGWGGAAVDQHRCGLGGDHGVEHGECFGFGHRADAVEHADRAERTLEHRRQGRFVQLQNDFRAEAFTHLGDVATQPLGEGLRKVAQRTGIGEREMPAGQLDLRGERQRTGHLQLDRAARAGRTRCLPSFFERVEVRAEQITGPPGHAAGAWGEPVSPGGGVESHVDQQRRHPPDQIRADAAAGQFHQVRQVGQLTEDGRGRFPRIGAGPRADCGRGATAQQLAVVRDDGIFIHCAVLLHRSPLRWSIVVRTNCPDAR